MSELISSLLRRHLEAGHLNRRDFVKRAAALSIGAPAVSAILAACGSASSSSSSSSSASSSSTSSGSSGSSTTPTPTQALTINENATPTGSPTTGAQTATTSGPSGGSVTLVRNADSDNLDPVTNDGNVNIWVFDNIYDQLVMVADNGLDLMPGLAEKWEASSDGLTYTFHLRSGIKFSDGTPMQVSDVIWSLKRAQTTQSSPWTFTLTAVKDFSSPDESTVVATLTEPWAPFLADMAMFNVSVVSQAFAQKIGVANLVDQCMGTGPFALKEWAKAQHITLVKNQSYWETGLPKLDQITIPVVPDTNSEILQLEGGQVDGIILGVPFSQVPSLSKNNNIQVLQWTSTFNNFIVINVRKPPLDDVKVRQALNYATDKETLIKTVLLGIGQVSNSFMPNGALYWNPNQKGYPFDLAQAQTLLKQSSHPNGFTVSINIASGSQQSLQTATILKSMWAKIGVNLSIQQLEQGVETNDYRTNNFQLELSGWTNDIIDPDELVSYAILPQQTENYHTGWTNQQAINLANQGRATLDPNKRRQIYYQIQQIHMDDAPFVYLYVVPYVDALNKKVKGYFHHPMGQYVFKNMYVQG